MKAPSPTKGVKPVFTGVAGVLIDSIPDDIVFGERRSKGSPYDALLLQLKAAGAGKFLRFDDVRAKPSLMARAKKLNIRVVFGDKDNLLFVSLAKVDLTTEGAADDQPVITRSDIVLAAIKAGRTLAGEITTFARSNGAPGIGLTQVDGLISNLARAGKIKLRTGRPGSNDGPDRWQLVA